MRRLCRSVPVEGYVLLLPATIVLSAYGIFRGLCSTNAVDVCTSFLEALPRMNLITSHDMVLFFVISLLGSALAGTLILQLRHGKTTKSDAARATASFCFIFGSIALIAITLGLLVCILFSIVDPPRVIRASHALMALDRKIFGVYPPLYLNTIIRSPLFVHWSMQAYLKLVTLLSVLLLLLPLVNVRLFRTFVLSYFLAFMTGFPLWYSMPALEPNTMYRANILRQEIAPEIQESILQADFPPLMQSYLSRFDAMWIDPKLEWLAVTNFPSMHAAWGVIIAWVLIEAWAPLIIIAIPWLSLNLLGTVLSLQHYAVDTVLGALIGLLAILAAKKLLQWEKRYLTHPWLLSSLTVFSELTEAMQRRFFSGRSSSKP